MDDNPLALKTLAEMLRSMTFRVEEAACGEDALAALESAERASDQFAIVFLDWRMPGLDGIETARRIAAMPLSIRPRRIMVTAHGREEVFREAESAALDGILVKPVSSSLLFDTAIRALGGEHILTTQTVASPVTRTDTRDLARLKGARALLVEDNELNQQVARELLDAAEVRVDVVENGAEGVARVQQEIYDFVLMDLQMPVMDGLEATRRIRALPGFSALPILAMTANAMAGDRERSLAAGMNDHVTKPIDPDQLFEVLLRWLPDRASRVAIDAHPPTRVAQHAAAPVADPQMSDLPLEIPGLDAADGLRRVMGRREAYVNLLRRFVSTQSKASEEIRASLGERRADAERAAHTLKGVAGTIGARVLQRDAGAVEGALRRDAPQVEIDPLLADLDRTLASVVGAIVAALPPEPAAPVKPAQVDPAVLQASVRRLERALSDEDAVEAIDAFRAAEPTLAAAFGERSERIGKLVRGYRFEDALAALRDAAST